MSSIASSYNGYVPDGVLSPDGKPAHGELRAMVGPRGDIVYALQSSSADDNKVAILRMGVTNFFLQPRAKTSAEIVEQSKQFKRARVNVVTLNDLPAGSTLNPSTKSGLEVTPATLALLDAQEANHDRKRVAKAARSDAKKQKAASDLVARADAWNLLHAALAGQPQEFVSQKLGSQEFKVGDLRLAAFFCGIEGASKLKKPELVAALAPRLLGPPPAPPAAAVEPDDEDFEGGDNDFAMVEEF